MMLFARLAKVWNTAVFWTWAFNGLRLGSAILLLPILVRRLPAADLGMHYTWVQYTTILVILDLSLALGIARNVAYAFQGAKKLLPLGLSEVPVDGRPNHQLLGQLLTATRHSYLIVSGLLFLFLALVGTSLVSQTIDQTSSPTRAWAGWLILLVSAPMEVYTGSHLVFLRGMNQVLLTARISTVVYGLKLVFSCALLLADFGLLAVPISTLTAAILQRILALHFARKTIPIEAQQHFKGNERELLGVLWPTTWRFGLQLLSNYLAVSGCLTIANKTLGQETTSAYSLSLNILYSICQGMAGVWTYVKWPLISQYRAEANFEGVKKVLRPRLWLQMGTYLLLAMFVIFAGPTLLEWLDPRKKLLPQHWLALLALHSMLESHFSAWTTLLSTENRIPSLWTTFATNIFGFVLAALFLFYTNLGLGSLVLGPFISASLFIYWYWPSRGARALGTGWMEFMFNMKTQK